jgi:hypothetical protein
LKINKRLNLVIDIKRDDGSTIYVHSTPISKEVFDNFWEISAQTVSALYTRKIGMFAARHAANMLRDVIKDNAGKDEGLRAAELARVESGFFAEIRRLTQVFAPGKAGWEMVPFETARRTLLDEDEVDEIENTLVFFTCASRSHLKSQQEIVTATLNVSNARPESLSCTDFMKSLPTLTPGENSGAKGT